MTSSSAARAGRPLSALVDCCASRKDRTDYQARACKRPVRTRLPTSPGRTSTFRSSAWAKSQVQPVSCRLFVQFVSVVHGWLYTLPGNPTTNVLARRLNPWRIHTAFDRSQHPGNAGFKRRCAMRCAACSPWTQPKVPLLSGTTRDRLVRGDKQRRAGGCAARHWRVRVRDCFRPTSQPRRAPTHCPLAPSRPPNQPPGHRQDGRQERTELHRARLRHADTKPRRRPRTDDGRANPD